MSDAPQITEIEAIRQIISKGIPMDYIDVVHEVKKRFGLDVTSADVEQVYHDMTAGPRARVSMTLTSAVPDEESQSAAATPESVLPESAQPAPTQYQQTPLGDLEHALQFVKSVQGLNNAKRLLAELESILLK